VSAQGEPAPLIEPGGVSSFQPHRTASSACWWRTTDGSTESPGRKLRLLGWLW